MLLEYLIFFSTIEYIKYSKKLKTTKCLENSFNISETKNFDFLH